MTTATAPLSPYTARPRGEADRHAHVERAGRQRAWRPLARVVGMFSGRGYNIASLTVAEVAHADHLSRITIVTSGTLDAIEQVVLQLDRLIPVHTVTDLTLRGESIERELAMIKVASRGEDRQEALAPRRSVPGPRDRRLDRQLRVRVDRRGEQNRSFRRT